MPVQWGGDSKSVKFDPGELLDCRSDPWRNIWQLGEPETRTRTLRAVRKARATALVAREPSPLNITVRDIQKVAGGCMKNKSTGLGLWAVRELSFCSIEDLDRLALLMRGRDSDMVVPSQW